MQCIWSKDEKLSGKIREGPEKPSFILKGEFLQYSNNIMVFHMENKTKQNGEKKLREGLFSVCFYSKYLLSFI